LAPLLSATSSSVSTWIMELHLHRAVHEPHGLPALRRGERPALADLDEVVGAELLGLVVGVELPAPLDVLAVDRITESAGHLDHDGLLGATGIRRVANDAPDEVPALAPDLRLLRSRLSHGVQPCFSAL